VSSDFDPSKNAAISSPGYSLSSSSSMSRMSAGSSQASATATIWLYHLRRDSLGEFRGSRIDFTIRFTDSHTESPRIDAITCGASSIVSGASSGSLERVVQQTEVRL
jgi:hypothetical protein